MRNVKIIADSAVDILGVERAPYASVPMKILSAEREFVDDEHLNVSEMVSYFEGYKGKSSTSCPNVSEWLDAFGDAEEVYCVTITSQLSGSYNAAVMAKQMYENEHPDRRVCVVDTRTAGPEMRLVVEKLAEWIEDGMEFDAISEQIQAYLKGTGLLFMLKSMKNLANNGRVSPVIARIAGLVGICVVGRASVQGVLEPLAKCRGEKRALEKIAERLKKDGLSHGKLYIAHCNNFAAASRLKEDILSELVDVSVEITECRGLCSFYAEQGGLLVGYERV